MNLDLVTKRALCGHSTVPARRAEVIDTFDRTRRSARDGASGCNVAGAAHS
jgi:hypothetical protein